MSAEELKVVIELVGQLADGAVYGFVAYIVADIVKTPVVILTMAFGAKYVLSAIKFVQKGN